MKIFIKATLIIVAVSLLAWLFNGFEVAWRVAVASLAAYVSLFVIFITIAHLKKTKVK